jgi:hypothetical protein
MPEKFSRYQLSIQKIALDSRPKKFFCRPLDGLLPIGYNATMRTNDHKATAAEKGLEWSAVLAIYREARELEAAEIARVAGIRKAAAAFMGYDHAGQFKLAKRSAMTTGDNSQLKGWDVCAAHLAATIAPELGDDPAAALYDLMAADAPAMSDADDAMTAAIDRAAELAAPAPAAGDFIRLVEAAAIADVTEQWLRTMVKAGKIRGIKAGRNWQVSRSDAEWFQRHPTMGRPRREAAPF